MKYQGIVELSVREYLGVMDGGDAWKHLRYAVGIKTDDGVFDYKTGEEYCYISRTKNGILDITRDQIEVGKVYAVQTSLGILNANKKYSKSQLDRYIDNSELFTDEYKVQNRGRTKILKKF